MSQVDQHALLDLVWREARLLDDGQYAEWRELWADDASYWIPLNPDDTDPTLQPAWLYEDRLLLDVRLARLQRPDAHSRQPRVSSLHVLQQPVVIDCQPESGRAELEARYVYVESQETTQVVLGARARYHCVRQAGEWRLHQKIVYLAHRDAPLPMIQGLP